jgi:thiol-disulfide isomerase/thioredoxin
MKLKKIKLSNLLFIALIALLIIPQTRTFIQVNLQKAIVKFSPFEPSTIAQEDQIQLQPFDYRLASLDGIKVNSPVGKGKVTFISYWATWCPPCIAEMPSLELLYADYGNKVNFLFITNEEPAKVQKFLDRKELNIPAVRPLMDTPENLYERSIPTNYVIDKKGNIVLKEQGAANWNTPEVRGLLDTLLTQS